MGVNLNLTQKQQARRLPRTFSFPFFEPMVAILIIYYCCCLFLYSFLFSLYTNNRIFNQCANFFSPLIFFMVNYFLIILKRTVSTLKLKINEEKWHGIKKSRRKKQGDGRVCGLSLAAAMNAIGKEAREWNAYIHNSKKKKLYINT